MTGPKKLERWERIERIVLVVASVLLIGVPALRFIFGYGGVAQLLLVPFGFWCIWQAFYEDCLYDDTPPTPTERLLFFLWLWARRLIVGGVGVVFISLGYYGMQHHLPGDFWGVCGAFLLGAFAIWIAFYGGGSRAYGANVRSIYLKRKARYKSN